MSNKHSKEEIDIFFKDSKLLDQHGQPEVLWHGSKSNTLKEFDRQYEGTGVVSSGNRKYGGFFFGSDKEGAEYYCYGSTPEEKIDLKKGQIFVETYGDDVQGWCFTVSQRDDIAYAKKYEEAVEEYREENGEDADIDRMDVDIEDEFEQIGNGGSYDSSEEADAAGERLVDEHNECFKKKVNPYLYPIHLRMCNPYIHDTEKDGFETGQALIDKVANSDIKHDGIKIINIFDGDRVMDVYIVFDPSNIMILDKMNPDSCGVTLERKGIESLLVLENTSSDEECIKIKV